MADIVTQTLRDKIDWHTTYTNGLTSDFLSGGKLPLTCATPQEAVMLALKPFPAEQARIVRIRDTAHLEDMWVSAALLAGLPDLPHVEQASNFEIPTFEE
jgi:hypothetical protein